MLFLGLSCITFGIITLSSGMAYANLVILEFPLQVFFYKESKIKVKNPLLKEDNISPFQNLDPDPLQVQRYFLRNIGFFTSPKP